MLQSLAFHVTIAIAIVNHYVYMHYATNILHHVISMYPNNQVQYDYYDIKAAAM